MSTPHTKKNKVLKVGDKRPTHQNGVPIVYVTGLSNEDRAKIKKMSSSGPKHLLKMPGTSTKRYDEKGVPVIGNNRKNLNRRGVNPRERPMQMIERVTKVLSRVFPDGSRTYDMIRSVPARFKRVFHTRAGWFR